MQNTAEQDYPGLVASYNNRPGNKVGLICKAPPNPHEVQNKTTWILDIIAQTLKSLNTK